MGSLSIGHWLVVLLIVMLVFGTKKLANMGADLGKAVKGFKDGIKSGEDSVADKPDELGNQPSHVTTEQRKKEQGIGYSI